MQFDFSSVMHLPMLLKISFELDHCDSLEVGYLIKAS